MIEKDFLYQNILNLDDIEEIAENLGSLNFFMYDNKNFLILIHLCLTEVNWKFFTNEGDKNH